MEQATVADRFRLIPPLAPQDEATIRAIIAGLAACWNAGDGSGYGAHFAEDADFVVIDGRHVRGRAAIAAGHQQIFDTIYRGSRIAMAVESVRLVRPDVAIVHVRAHLKLQPQQGETPGENLVRSTWILTETDGGWQVVAFQNTAIVPEAERGGEGPA